MTYVIAALVLGIVIGRRTRREHPSAFKAGWRYRSRHTSLPADEDPIGAAFEDGSWGRP